LLGVVFLELWLLSCGLLFEFGFVAELVGGGGVGFPLVLHFGLFIEIDEHLELGSDGRGVEVLFHLLVVCFEERISLIFIL
jgi:hypothetical protein